MKAAILYHSKSGNTQRMADVIAEGMASVHNTEVKTFSIFDVDKAFIKDSSCVIIGTPTYLASMSGDVKNWLDGPALGLGLSGKIGGAFATADYVHGGADIAIMHVLNHLMVLGMLTYSGGGACGRPVIHLGPVALKNTLAENEDVFRLYGQRMATKTWELFRV